MELEGGVWGWERVQWVSDAMQSNLKAAISLGLYFIFLQLVQPFYLLISFLGSDLCHMEIS